jgi:hypothetical protein
MKAKIKQTAGSSAMSAGLRWTWQAGAISLLTALFGVSCTAALVRETEGTGTDAAIAILSKQHSKLETKAAACIADAVRAAHPTLRIVTADEFRRTIFAYSAPDGPSARAKYFETLVSDPAVQQRMASFGIRQVVYMAEARTDTRQRGVGDCTGGLGWGACVGVIWWERDSRLLATVVDVQGARAVGEVRASAKGSPGLIMLLPLFVLPVPNFPETRACAELGEAVAGFLQSDAPAAGPEEKGVVE